MVLRRTMSTLLLALVIVAAGLAAFVRWLEPRFAFFPTPGETTTPPEFGVAFDYRGYGVSTGRPSESGLYRDVDAIVQHAVASRQPSLPIVYWGRSLGSTMAAYASTRQR